MRAAKEEEAGGDPEKVEGGSQKGERATYEFQVVKPIGEGETEKTMLYDAEGQCVLFLSAERCEIEEVGERVRPTALYICKREGRLHLLGTGQELVAEERWRGISLEYWYLTMTGIYGAHMDIPIRLLRVTNA